MTTMLDKVAVAGDITQAIDRTGCWACALTIIGGTSETAVKLQSCDTADGTFEDFKELISSSEASAEQYKGFVVDLFGAKKFIKVVGATMATAVFGDCDHDVKKITVKAGEIPSGADLENNKAVTIDVSAYTEPVVVNPTSGKDGMKKTTVTLDNIPSGGEVEANKTATIDVSQYTEPVEITPTSPNDSMAKATITLSNIPSGGGGYNFYGWSHLDLEEGTSVCFTLTETPTTSNKSYPNGYVLENPAGEPKAITAVGSNEITVDNVVYIRDSTWDFSLTV